MKAPAACMDGTGKFIILVCHFNLATKTWLFIHSSSSSVPLGCLPQRFRLEHILSNPVPRSSPSWRGDIAHKSVRLTSKHAHRIASGSITYFSVTELICRPLSSLIILNLGTRVAIFTTVICATKTRQARPIVDLSNLDPCVELVSN